MQKQEYFLLLAIILFSSVQFIFLGKYSLTLNGDELDSVFSVLMGTSFSDDSRSLWYRYAAGGSDQLSIGYTPDFDRLLVEYLPSWLAYQVRHLLQSAAAIIGIYYLSRLVFSIPREGALFASFAAGCFYALANFYMSAVMFLPILLLSIGLLLDNPKNWKLLAFALLSSVLYSTTAHIQFLIGFPFIIIGIWFLTAKPQTSIKSWLIIFAISLPIILLRLQDVAALSFNAEFSHRANWAHYAPPLHEAAMQGIRRVWTYLNPTNIGSITSFNSTIIFSLMAVIGLILHTSKSHSNKRLLWTIVALIAADIALPIVKYFLSDIITQIRGFSINKLWTMSSFTIFIAAGLAYQSFFAWATKYSQTFRSRKRQVSFILMPILAIGLLEMIERISYSGYEWLSQGNYVQIYESPILESLAKKIDDSKEPSRVSMFQMYDSYAQGYGLETAGGMLVLFSKRYSDFWNEMSAPSKGVDLFADKVREVASQTMILGSIYTTDDKSAERELNERYRLNFLSLANVRYLISRDKLTDKQLRLVNEGPEVPWTSLNKTQKALESFKANFTGRTHLYVYENMNALPRFYFAKGFKSAPTSQETLSAISSLSETELKETVFISQNDVQDPKILEQSYSTRGEVHINSYQSDTIELTINVDGPRLLVASNSYSPYWVCRVDGVEVPILPAYTTFWAVQLPANAHKVVFSYEPPYRIKSLL